MGTRGKKAAKAMPINPTGVSAAASHRATKRVRSQDAKKQVTRAHTRGAPERAIQDESKTVRAQPPAAEAWRKLAYEISVALEALEEDEGLVVSAKRTNRFVQFMAQGSFGMRAEAVSDFYLPDTQQLSQQQAAGLIALGWSGPTNLPDQLELGGRSPDGSPNYFLDLAKPVPYDILGALAVATFTSVYIVGHPGELEYTAFGPNNASIRFPHLGLRRQLK